MKSRILISHSNLPVLSRSKLAFSTTRRFELQAVSRGHAARRGRKARRGGQALLLAVAIMLLAALLSASFLAVLSGNLNQTARIADKTRAIEASRAGVQFVNQQLSYSKDGDMWRPTVPAPLSPLYYSQLDRVQGWATQGYAKYPDPNQPIGNAPKFLVKVEEIPIDLPDTDPQAEHRGEIKITSIGLSDDDPNVFHRTVAYKAGRAQSPWGRALRSVSNWDFKRNRVPTLKIDKALAANAAAASTVPVTLTVPDSTMFSPDDLPFNIVIARNRDKVAPTVEGAVVTAIPSGTQITLSKLDNAINIDDSVLIEKAAAIGTADTIDLLNTGQTPVAFPVQNQPSGILTNGSLWLQGQVQLSSLQAPAPAVQKAGAAIKSSGVIALSGTKTVTGTGDVATPGGQLLASDTSQFPGTFTTMSGAKKSDLVDDAWNLLSSSTTPTYSRNVEPFKPADLSGKENLPRYRALTRDSDTASNGYQEGVYIDNKDDIEKVDATAMTQKQLVDMLVSTASVPKSVPENYTRSSEASDFADTAKSLEQKHLRGWVGPDEFLARGALVELTNDAYPLLGITAPSIRVTLDARGDSTTAAPNSDTEPVATKAWRKADGTPDTGVYTKVLPWPANGTIFSEGNLRIRGDVATSPAPRSLTVVSLGNIYIEGSLSVDNTASANRKKLLLLAKKNVIVNPTRAVLARTDVQTVATNTTGVIVGATSNTFSLSVANAYAFNKGDYVTVAAQKTINDPTAVIIHGLVTADPTATSPQITITTPDKGYIPPLGNGIVRSPLEKRSVGTGASDRAFFSVIDNEAAINRRIVAPFADNTTPGYNKLNLDHVADLKKNGTDVVGFKISAKDISTAIQRPTPPTFFAELTNKQPLKLSPVGSQDLDSTKDAVQLGDKVLRTYNGFTAGNQKFFYDPPATNNLLQLLTDAQAVTEQRTTPTIEGYKYEASLVDFPAAERIDPITGLPDPSKTIGVLSYHALAGVGLRYQPAATDTSLNNRREDFNDPKEYTVPLATSVEIDLNGGSSWAKLTSGSLVTRYFGFTPAVGDTEDIQTVDSSFYQASDALSKSTLDARILDFASNPAGSYGSSFVLRRAAAPNAASAPAFTLLPDYRVKAVKYEYANLSGRSYKPVANMRINAFVYAQEGSWFVVPGGYFRSNPPVRGEADSSGNLTGSYVDYNNNGTPDAGEYILQSTAKLADLNRNGVPDPGEKDAALRFVRYNYAPIQFFGAIVENQTAVVADVTVPGANVGDPPIVVQKGAVQDWMDKWATYTGSGTSNVGAPAKFTFITYSYDPSLANGTAGADELKVPVTTDLLYEQ